MARPGKIGETEIFRFLKDEVTLFGGSAARSSSSSSSSGGAKKTPSKTAVSKKNAPKSTPSQDARFSKFDENELRELSGCFEVEKYKDGQVVGGVLQGEDYTSDLVRMEQRGGVGGKPLGMSHADNIRDIVLIWRKTTVFSHFDS